MHRGVDFRAETADVGPKGCLVVSPRPLDPGTWVRLMLQADPLPEKLRVTGRVAWAVQPARVRAGVAFAEMQVERNQDPFAWFERLMRAIPGLAPRLRHVPDRLPYDTPLYLSPPPRFIVDFSEAELRLVAGMRNGTTVQQLLYRMERERKNEGRLIFALLARRVLSLSPRDACDPAAWRPVLQQAGIASRPDADEEPEEVVRLADLVVEPDPQVAPPGAEREILPSWLSQTNPGWSERPGSRLNVPPPAPARAGLAADDGPAPPLLREAPYRSPQAQQQYEHALACAAAGDLQGALRLMRQALELSPGDAEIAQALGQLAFRDRKAPAR